MKDNLPPNFRTWNEFYTSFKDKTDPSINEVNYQLWIPDDSPTGRYQQIYRYTVDEVKAHCYDEFIEWFLKNVDSYVPEMGAYHIERIERFLHVNTNVKYT